MKIKLFTVPNIITLGNLLCGCLSIVASLVVGDFKLALIFIVASAVCDFFDGFTSLNRRLFSLRGESSLSLYIIHQCQRLLRNRRLHRPHHRSFLQPY